MKLLLVEDERLAADRLSYLVYQYDPSIEVIGPLESVKETVDYLKNKPAPDLILLDIQLADGVSCDIFRQQHYDGPVIFTTAYDEFAIDAFKLFSIDYILKPVTLEALTAAFNKFRQIRRNSVTDYQQLINELQSKKQHYKERVLGKIGQRSFLIEVNNVAFFQAEDKLVYLCDKAGTKYLIDSTLEKLELQLNPKDFFRLNRKLIVRIDCIDCIKSYPNNRLKLVVKSAPLSNDFIISRERVPLFKEWIS